MAHHTLLSMMKDEAPALLEWVAYHRHIGFDRICVYTNDCSDGTDALLDRLAEMGEVRRFDNPVPPGGKPQPLALRRADKASWLAETDWLMVTDADEFLNIKAGDGHLRDLIATCPTGTNGVVVTWRMMGSSGLTDWTAAPVIETYQRGAPDLFRRGWGVKTLFQPFDDMKLGIHRPTIKGKGAPEGRSWVNGSGKPMTRQFVDGLWRSSLATLGYAHAELAHFAVKSRECYLMRGLRGNVNAKPDKYDATYFAVFDRNETEQVGLARHAAAVRDRVAGYLRDPVLAGLHAAGLAWHRRALARLRAGPDHARQMADLAKAADTPLDALDDLLFIQPLAPQGKAMVARMRAANIPDPMIARAVAAAVSRAEAARDAADAVELRARGVTPDYMS